MKKFVTKCGYKAYSGSPTEIMTATGGLGICDWCAKPTPKMYVVPVLNSAMCEKCFEDWNQRAVIFKEDLSFEKEFIKCFDRQIKAANIQLEDLTK